MSRHPETLVGRASFAAMAVLAQTSYGAFRAQAPRALLPGELAVIGPGNYDRPGTTYVLTQDVRAPSSALFLGKDVVLDLNGYTLTYADAGYQHVPNHRFDEGLKGWDTAKAPGAKVRPAQWNRMVGDTVLVLPEGEELVSGYVTLPVANRSYYAVAAVANQDMHVGIYVEDEQGRSVECAYRFGGSVRPCCPETRRGPKLGGGTVFALLFGQPSGKYRVRLKAVQGECVIGTIDLLPAMDVGVGIVDETRPWAYYQCILDGDDCAFFDHTKPGAPGHPVDTIPRVTGAGTITIRNGVIRSAFDGIRSWGVQSTAPAVRLVVENVRFVASGINTFALSAPFATMTDCRTEIDTPWIIDRHRQSDYGVSLVAGKREPSLVSACVFMGGQGQLAVGGDHSDIRDCLFVNKQTVVNHYSLGAGGQGTKVHGNRFLPEQGSGILIGRQQGVEVFENEFVITASPPVNEYYDTDYSVSAIRLTDYNANRSDRQGYCGNNLIHHNRIRIVGRRYPEAHPSYKPMAYGIFMSVGGDQNSVYDNDIVVEQQDPPNGATHGAYAFYIGGSDNGGVYYNNRVTANVTPVWVANLYGPAKNVTFHDNTFVKAAAAESFPWFKLGYYKHPAQDVRFFSNTFEGLEFGVWIDDDATHYVSAYDVGWTLAVTTAAGAEIAVLDGAGKEVARATADAQGAARLRLVQYRAKGAGLVVEDGKRQVKIERTDVSAYRVRANGQETAVVMDQDRNVAL